jgi:hypothetical protein
VAAYTAADVIAQARVVLNDNNATIGYRKSDAAYIKHLNMALAALSTVRPELFETEVPFTCSVGPLQRLRNHVPPIDSLKFRGCDRDTNGHFMTRFEKTILDRYNPTWGMGATSVFPRQWCEHESMVDMFWVFPPTDAGAVIYVRHIAPPDVLVNPLSTFALPNSYLPALVDYVVYVESSTDDESVNSQRAVAFFQQYLAEPGVASRLPASGS